MKIKIFEKLIVLTTCLNRMYRNVEMVLNFGCIMAIENDKNKLLILI
jgi:hypothetical protein